MLERLKKLWSRRKQRPLPSVSIDDLVDTVERTKAYPHLGAIAKFANHPRVKQGNVSLAELNALLDDLIREEGWPRNPEHQQFDQFIKDWMNVEI